MDCKSCGVETERISIAYGLAECEACYHERITTPPYMPDIPGMGFATRDGYEDWRDRIEWRRELDDTRQQDSIGY